MAMLAAMRQLLEEKRRLEKETIDDDAWATSPDTFTTDLAPGLESAVAASQKFAAEARTPLLRARRKCWYDAEVQRPVILRDLLASDDVAKLRRMRAALEASGRAPHMFRDATTASNHAVCYLHYDGFAQRTEPELMERLLAAMRAHAPSVWPRSTQKLHIRCIELHTYKEGGGLFLPRHRDNDSVLTLSCRVSEDGAFGGGRFVTYDRGAPVAHRLDQGSAVLFPSEKLHNIERVESGTRESLVIELWEGGTNGVDRFK